MYTLHGILFYQVTTISFNIIQKYFTASSASILKTYFIMKFILRQQKPVSHPPKTM